ncbi:putative xanthine dehydrogenase subunit C [Paenibacillus sp. J45TS6]|nr:putative xanthine dehydrogenase subunit C [Paenibacillus sp. J45TS6]
MNMGIGSERVVYPELWQPESMEEARKIANNVSPHYQWAAGTTLLRTQWEMGTAPVPKHLISLANIRELNACTAEEDGLRIGALMKLNACAAFERIQSHFPILSQAIDVISAPSIRNLATLGGNIVSGVGDSIPVLLVYEASLRWMTDKGLMEKKLTEWLEEWRRGQRSADHFLTEIWIPLPEPKPEEERHTVSFFKKIGRREAFTPALVTIAFHGTLNSQGEWSSLAMAAGGGSGTAMRLIETEKWIREFPVSGLPLSELMKRVQDEFVTISDVFATGSYRKQAAAGLFASELWKSMRTVRNSV